MPPQRQRQPAAIVTRDQQRLCHQPACPTLPAAERGRDT
eukprot:CAMPEP_0180149892 /NCGR_PEP_ID=MMETSP0986-20121125/21098_1 /TAXON_ID=697907 /ORGANISM="non described non described, Strain CCMP2293" /LENGTH=38 /DNA_ID= /DNA_START= /DNA_END= /DNA_ORIENTATION=